MTISNQLRTWVQGEAVQVNITDMLSKEAREVLNSRAIKFLADGVPNLPIYEAMANAKANNANNTPKSQGPSPRR